MKPIKINQEDKDHKMDEQSVASAKSTGHDLVSSQGKKNDKNGQVVGKTKEAEEESSNEEPNPV